MAVHHQELLAVSLLGFDASSESTMNAVVLQEVDHVIQIHEGVVDGLDGHHRIGTGGPEDQSTDAPKSVDNHAYFHLPYKLRQGVVPKGLWRLRNMASFPLNLAFPGS